jgi:hypothetical protein
MRGGFTTILAECRQFIGKNHESRNTATNAMTAECEPYNRRLRYVYQRDYVVQSAEGIQLVDGDLGFFFRHDD